MLVVDITLLAANWHCHLSLQLTTASCYLCSVSVLPLGLLWVLLLSIWLLLSSITVTVISQCNCTNCRCMVTVLLLLSVSVIASVNTFSLSFSIDSCWHINMTVSILLLPLLCCHQWYTDMCNIFVISDTSCLVIPHQSPWPTAPRTPAVPIVDMCCCSCEANDITQLQVQSRILLASDACWTGPQSPRDEVSETRRSQSWEAMSSSSVCAPLMGLGSKATGHTDLWRRDRGEFSKEPVHWWTAISSLYRRSYAHSSTCKQIEPGFRSKPHDHHHMMYDVCNMDFFHQWQCCEVKLTAFHAYDAKRHT